MNIIEDIAAHQAARKITIGRIVHAVVKNGFGTFVERPAIVTRTWGEGAVAIQCTVFFDGVNDGLIEQAKSSLVYYPSPVSPATNTPGASMESWHWPDDKHTLPDGTLADE